MLDSVKKLASGHSAIAGSTDLVAAAIENISNDQGSYLRAKEDLTRLQIKKMRRDAGLD